LEQLGAGLADSGELLQLAIEEGDRETLDEVVADLRGFEERIEELEFRRMFSGEMDANNAFVDIQSGAGGTEAQDWADMILRMYLRWAESHGFGAEIIEKSEGEVAGISSVVSTRMAGCAPRPACTGWCASHHSTPAIAGILPSHPCLYPPKWTTT
jgi:peptide chain release factor 2